MASGGVPVERLSADAPSSRRQQTCAKGPVAPVAARARPALGGRKLKARRYINRYPINRFKLLVSSILSTFPIFAAGRPAWDFAEQLLPSRELSRRLRDTVR